MTRMTYLSFSGRSFACYLEPELRSVIRHFKPKYSYFPQINFKHFNLKITSVSSPPRYGGLFGELTEIDGSDRLPAVLGKPLFQYFPRAAFEQYS